MAIEVFNKRKLEVLQEFQKEADEIQDAELNKIWAVLKIHVETTKLNNSRSSGNVLKFPIKSLGNL